MQLENQARSQAHKSFFKSYPMYQKNIIPFPHQMTFIWWLSDVLCNFARAPPSYLRPSQWADIASMPGFKGNLKWRYYLNARHVIALCRKSEILTLRAFLIFKLFSMLYFFCEEMHIYIKIHIYIHVHIYLRIFQEKKLTFLSAKKH